jgi:biuret amidohydrolase
MDDRSEEVSISTDFDDGWFDRAALLLMHFQADVLRLLFSEAMPPVLMACNDLIDRWRPTGRPIVQANFCLGNDHEHVDPGNRLVAALAPLGLFRDGRPADGLLTTPADRLYLCPRVNIFHGTSLHEDLSHAGVRRIVMAGLTSSGVVLSSVAWASDMDYDLRLVRDACYDPDEDAHEALFRTGFATRATII